MPFFQPAIYGVHAAAALEALYTRLHITDADESFINTNFSVQYYLMTQPSGSRFEAEILLSCNGIKGSPVGQMIYEIGRCFQPEDAIDLDIDTETLSHFISLETLHEKTTQHPRSRHYNKKVQDNYNTMVASAVQSVLLYRTDINWCNSGTEPVTGPVFSDTLFGPYVSKVFNSLMKLEIRLADNDTRPSAFPDNHRETFAALDDLDERMSSALHSERGTAFAGDLLVLQHVRSVQTGSMIIKLKEEEGFECGLVDALFPMFGDLPKPLDQIGMLGLDISIHSALKQVRLEMDYIIRIVHGQALPILMAGNRRLGEDSPLGTLDAEILRWIAQIVIFGD
jgi:hypothetical protein